MFEQDDGRPAHRARDVGRAGVDRDDARRALEGCGPARERQAAGGRVDKARALDPLAESALSSP